MESRVCHDRRRNYIITRGGGDASTFLRYGEETPPRVYTVKSECNRDEVAYQPLLAHSVKYTLLSMLSARCSIHLRGKWNYKRIPPPPWMRLTPSTPGLRVHTLNPTIMEALCSRDPPCQIARRIKCRLLEEIDGIRWKIGDDEQI